MYVDMEYLNDKLFSLYFFAKKSNDFNKNDENIQRVSLKDSKWKYR